MGRLCHVEFLQRAVKIAGPLDQTDGYWNLRQIKCQNHNVQKYIVAVGAIEKAETQYLPQLSAEFFHVETFWY